MNLHCTSCAFIATTTKDAMAHVRQNPTHTVIGAGAEPGTTITVTITKD